MCIESPWSLCADTEGGGAGGRGYGSLEKSKIKGFLVNICPDPLQITKLPSQHSMLDHHRHASETPFKWRFVSRTVMARL